MIRNMVPRAHFPRFEAHTAPNGNGGTTTPNGNSTNGKDGNNGYSNGVKPQVRRNVFNEPSFLHYDLTTDSEHDKDKKRWHLFRKIYLRWWPKKQQCIRSSHAKNGGPYVILGLFHKGRVRPDEIFVSTKHGMSWVFWKLWWKITVLRGLEGLFSLQDVGGFQVYRCVERGARKAEEPTNEDQETLTPEDGGDQSDSGQGSATVAGGSESHSSNAQRLGYAPNAGASASSVIDIDLEGNEKGKGKESATKLGKVIVLHESVAYLSQEDEHSLQLLYAAYSSWRMPNGAGKDWSEWIHQNLNHGIADPKQCPELKAYALEVILDWSAKRIFVALLAPIVLSVGIGLYIMNYDLPYELERLEAAWSIAAYAVTAGGLLAGLLGLTNGMR